MTKIPNNCRTCQKRNTCKFGHGMAITWTHCGQWLPDGNGKETVVVPDAPKERPTNLLKFKKCVLCGGYIPYGSKRRLYCSDACYREAMRRKKLLKSSRNLKGGPQ